MLRIVVFVLLTVTLAACQRSSSSPTAPTPTPTPTPATTPAPTPPPTPPPPTFPSMVGGWSGTLAVSWIRRTTIGDVRNSTTCDITWLISSQTAGGFSGTYQNSGSGGTASPCSSAGTVSGTISSAGVVTASPMTLPSPCTRTSGTGAFTGIMSANGGLTAQGNDVIHCTIVLAPDVTVVYDEERAMTLLLNRR